jgi:enamine deaminase RidA (YjgF/YER057c/UK114 family)
MSVKRHEVGATMSRVVEHNGTVYVAGTTAGDIKGDIKDQTRQVLKTIDDRLKMGGTDKSKLLSAQIFVSDVNLRPAMNEVWQAWLDPANTPTRACVQAGLAPGVLVEIVVVAAK